MFEQKFFGTATVGEKGQIVIPHEARNKIDLKVGDKLLVCSGPGNHGLFLIKSDMIKNVMAKMTEKFQKMQSEIDKSEGKS